MTKHRLSRGWINNYLVAAHFQLQWQQLDLDHKLDHLDICRMSRGWLVASHPKSRWRPASLNITFTQIRHPIQEYQVFQMVAEPWRSDPSVGPNISICVLSPIPTTVLIRLELSHLPNIFPSDRVSNHSSWQQFESIPLKPHAPVLQWHVCQHTSPEK